MNAKISNENLSALRALEEDLWRPETRFDIPYMKRLLAPDFVEFGRSGQIYDRASSLSVPRIPFRALIPLPNFKHRLLSNFIVHTTYDTLVVIDGINHYAHRSSIWSFEFGSWRLQFHQATPYEPVF